MAYDELEERILSAASRLLIRYGYDKTTLDDVAREAGLSRSTLYTRWKKKDTLFHAVVWQESLRYTDVLLKRMENNLEAGTLPGFFSVAMQVLYENPFMSTLYTRDRHVLGALLLRADMVQLYTWRITSTMSFLSILQQAGTIRPEVDIQTLSYILSSLQLGILKMGEVIPHEQSPPFERIMQETIDMLNAYASPASVNLEAGHAALMTYLRTLREQVNEVAALLSQR
jgi:AcrR family transcriptional regulator